MNRVLCLMDGGENCNGKVRKTIVGSDVVAIEENGKKANFSM